MLLTLALVFAITSFIIGTIAMIMGIIAFIELRSFQKSTHQVQFQPVDKAIDEVDLDKEQENLFDLDKEQLKKIREDRFSKDLDNVL